MLNSVSKEFLNDFSVEVTPKTFFKNREIIQNLKKNKRVFIAQIEGFKKSDMLKTARLIFEDGNIPVPHIPARQIKDKNELEDLINIYRSEAGVKEVLLIAGSNKTPYGNFDSTLQLIETGLFNSGFESIYFAGHPEGNKDIEVSEVGIDASLRLKNEFSKITEAKVILVTQFCFDVDKIISWSKSLLDQGINLPIHIGVAGPSKLTSLMKYSLECGVGPSLQILESNFLNIGELVSTYSPNNFINELIQKIELKSNLNIKNIHFYPFGGIKELIKSIN